MPSPSSPEPRRAGGWPALPGRASSGRGRVGGSDAAYSHYERLSALDASFLDIEDENSPMRVHLAADFEALRKAAHAGRPGARAQATGRTPSAGVAGASAAARGPAPPGAVRRGPR